MTERYARAFGFASVSLGNESPDVLSAGGALVIGHVGPGDDPLHGVEKIGSTCTDLWAVTVIERTRLVEIVAETAGDEKAERVVDAYLAGNGEFVTRMQVPPGTYHLYFSGDHDEFAARFRSPDLPLPATVEPIFVLSPRKLALEPAEPAPEAEGPRP
jgi:hypothetical protein